MRRVYFFGCEDAGAVKIGICGDRVYERLNQAQVNCPLQLTLLAAFDGGLQDEADLHSHFAHLRIRGEWFRATPELLDHIKQFPRPEKPARGWHGQKRNRQLVAA